MKSLRSLHLEQRMTARDGAGWVRDGCPRPCVAGSVPQAMSCQSRSMICQVYAHLQASFKLPRKLIHHHTALLLNMHIRLAPL